MRPRKACHAAKSVTNGNFVLYTIKKKIRLGLQTVLCLFCTLQRILGKSVANNEKFYRVVSEPEPY